MKTLFNTISYVSLFAFLLSINGCMTTEQYSDTPDKVFSNESDVLSNENYVLDSLSLNSNRTIRLSNYVLRVFEKQKEKYLTYYNPKLLVIDYALMRETNSKDLLYKKPVADTLSLKDIKMMHFTRSKTDISYAILGCVIGIPVVLFFGLWLLVPTGNH
jgi:hypothetical protein